MNGCRALLPLVLLSLGACAMPGYRGTWMPDAVELTVADEDGAPIAQLRVSVPGQWHGAPADGELRVLLAVENVGPSPLSLPPGRAELILGDKRSCGSARNVAGADTTVPPGQSALFELGFMPPDDADLGQLLVSWVLVVDGQDVPGSQAFEREDFSGPRYGGIKVSSAGTETQWTASSSGCVSAAPQARRRATG